MNNIPKDAIIHIEGHSELIRDPKTGAVINTATSEYKRFVEKREKEKTQQKRIKELETNLCDLQTKYDTLTEMMAEIIKKIG